MKNNTVMSLINTLRVHTVSEEKQKYIRTHNQQRRYKIVRRR